MLEPSHESFKEIIILEIIEWFSVIFILARDYACVIKDKGACIKT